MILGEKVYNGSWTMLDPYNLDPQGVPFKTLSIQVLHFLWTFF